MTATLTRAPRRAAPFRLDGTARRRQTRSVPDAQDEPEDLTRVLHAAARGSLEGQEALEGLLDHELRRLAGRLMGREDVDHTLQPTALVGEAWLRLFGGRDVAIEDRRHFRALAARAMRQVLVDHARAQRRVKRSGAWGRVRTADVDAVAAEGGGGDDGLGIDVLDLDAALEELAELSPRQARVVELRYFAGLDEEEIAASLEVSARTVRREWRFARAWLVKRLGA